ncbi:MAG TPA: tyramine oxidase, partial [Stellaceae bacterium]|nr:tyramine oxidase [Stellaceae bacterium]
ADEIASSVAAVRSSGLADDDTKFSMIDLDEPEKASVLAWTPDKPFARSAFVVARRERTVYEGVVDLSKHVVTRWQPVSGAQSSILASEWERAQQITLADPGWRAAIRKRGYETFDGFFCAPFSAGYFADPAEIGKRLLKVVCYDARGSTNVWGRPVEGLYAVVDLDEQRVVKLVDTGVVPVSSDAADFAAAGSAPTAKPSAPAGNIAFDGNTVRWKEWSFHFRMDPRVGPIVSLLRYRDGQRDRPVLYRGSLGEMFVPYMDPDPSWSFRTYMDIGEYGFGVLASPLAPGIDCPADAHFLDATLADENGEPVLVKSRMCLFERNTDAPLWRHAEFANKTYAGRPARELVLRSIPSVGNYDYVIDWVLTEAGAVRIDVGATGIDEVKGVAARRVTDPSAAGDTAYGTLVAPNLTAVNHDHFLSFRLDVDIDGQANSLVRRKLVPQRINGANGRRSLWRVIEETITKEGAITPDSHGGDEIWRIINPGATNALGDHPGYELQLGHSVASLLASDDFPQRRAAFTAAPLWVTAYDPTELYAAGAYPNQGKGGEGLPAYVQAHRSVSAADIVLWVTMGFRHVPRPEDWPVMATMWHSLSLVPDGFFDQDPAVGVPSATGEGTRQ